MRLADFIIAGAPRSGTTWLYEVLDLHPDVYMAKPVRPEPKFFLRDELYLQGPAAYAKWFEGARPDQLTGEKSTNYLESKIVAKRIHENLPNVKLIFILRDPVERAWSNYLWTRMNGLETLSFPDACSRELERERNYSPQHRTSRPYSYVSRGFYADLLAAYVSRFQLSRMLVLRFEDVLVDPGALGGEVHAFLGVRPRADDGRAIPQANPSVKRGDSIFPSSLRKHLQQVYREPNARLQRLVGRATPFWDYGDE